MPVTLPRLPYAEFPLRPHANGQWFKSIWSSINQRSQQFYFGSWKDDATGERALHDPQIGWLVRRSAIKAGTDNLRVTAVASIVTLGELMSRYLTFKRELVLAGDLSARTLGDYIREMEKFVAFLKPTTPVAGLRPDHFAAYMKHMVEDRKLGRYARRRVRVYVSTMLRFGAKNDWYSMPSTGTSWVSPATDAASIRQSKMRAGKKDYSDRIISGDEFDALHRRATPTFKAILLVGINCGFGPADIGRLRWNMIDMKTGRIAFARPKTGVRRETYLWKKTRNALLRVRSLRRNREALERDGEDTLVFITRRGHAYYREREVHQVVELDGKKIKKVVGVAVENAVSITFHRMAKELKFQGLCFYRLRHSFKTLGKSARDREALDLAMGHADGSVSRLYDHEQIDWHRIRKVSRAVYFSLWPKIKQSEDMPKLNGMISKRVIDASEQLLVN